MAYYTQGNPIGSLVSGMGTGLQQGMAMRREREALAREAAQQKLENDYRQQQADESSKRWTLAQAQDLERNSVLASMFPQLGLSIPHPTIPIPTAPAYSGYGGPKITPFQGNAEVSPQLDQRVPMDLVRLLVARKDATDALERAKPEEALRLRDLTRRETAATTQGAELAAAKAWGAQYFDLFTQAVRAEDWPTAEKYLGLAPLSVKQQYANQIPSQGEKQDRAFKVQERAAAQPVEALKRAALLQELNTEMGRPAARARAMQRIPTTQPGSDWGSAPAFLGGPRDVPYQATSTDLMKLLLDPTLEEDGRKDIAALLASTLAYEREQAESKLVKVPGVGEVPIRNVRDVSPLIPETPRSLTARTSYFGVDPKTGARMTTTIPYPLGGGGAVPPMYGNLDVGSGKLPIVPGGRGRGIPMPQRTPEKPRAGARAAAAVGNKGTGNKDLDELRKSLVRMPTREDINGNQIPYPPQGSTEITLGGKNWILNPKAQMLEDVKPGYYKALADRVMASTQATTRAKGAVVPPREAWEFLRKNDPKLSYYERLRRLRNTGGTVDELITAQGQEPFPSVVQAAVSEGYDFGLSAEGSKEARAFLAQNAGKILSDKELALGAAKAVRKFYADVRKVKVK